MLKAAIQYGVSLSANIQIIQTIVFKVGVQCGVSLLSNIQIFKSFLFKTAIQCGVSLSTNIQSFKSFKNFFHSRQLFSMALAFQQTFNPSNHSKFLLFKTALQRSFSFQHSHRNFFRNCFSSC